MNLRADEGVDRPIVERLRLEGYSILYVAEMQPGIADEAVLDIANQQEAILLTADKDFGLLVFRQQRLNTGVVLLRLAGLSLVSKASIVAEALQQHLSELQGAFTVIVRGSIRIRRQHP